MMLTIHGLPMSTKYQDLKALVKQQCNITDFILDNLVGEGNGTKKVRIGVSDDREGAYLMKSLSGYRYSGNILQVVPVGKTAPMNAPQQNYDQRGYAPRNDYPNQGPDYGEPMGQSRPEPWGSGGPTSQWGSNQPSINQPNMTPNNYNYPQTGPSMNQSYQQAPIQRPDLAPYDRQGYPPDRQAYAPAHTPLNQQYQQGYPPKGNIPSEPMNQRAERSGRTHVLRSVELMEEPLRPQHRALLQPNTVGVAKESDGYGATAFPAHGQPAAWSQHQNKPYDRNYQEADSRPGLLKPSMPYERAGAAFSRDEPKPTPRFSPTRDVTKNIHTSRFSPRRDIPQMEGHVPRFSPRDVKDDRIERGGPKEGHVPRFSPRRDIRFSPRRDVPKDSPRFSPRREIPKEMPRFSPRRDVAKDMPRYSPRREVSKDEPRFSPRRDVPKDSRFSPRRDVGKGPRFSPRRDVPKEGAVPRFSPRREELKDARGSRLSPRREKAVLLAGRSSPGPRDPHKRARYSPSRREDKSEKYSPEAALRSLKTVRPAYEPPPQAPSQAMYSGGYRPNLREGAQYPERSSPWQQDKNFSVQKEEGRRDPARIPKFEPREVTETKRSRSPVRKSRSPLRRERSPARDRFKKHSPSPRSPRRSWALEKRRSPDNRDAPPPPMWPGDNREDDFKRPFSGRDDEKPNRVPVWEPPYEASDRHRHVEENRRGVTDPIRVRIDLTHPSQSGPASRDSPHHFKQEDRVPKFEPRESRFDVRDPKFEPRDPKFEPRQPKFEPREPEFERRQPQFESREPKFEPREPKFEPREPKFEPRELKHHEPKFQPREPKFEPRELKFEHREHKFEPREPKFEPREDFPERRGDFRRDDRPPSRDFRADHEIDRRERKNDYPRREERKEIPIIHEKFDKELDDIYKRAKEFNKRAQELRKREELVEQRSRIESKERIRDIREEKESHLLDSRRPEDGRRRRDDFDLDWKLDEDRSHAMSPNTKAKRDKAVEELATRILDKHGKHYPADLKTRVHEELKISLVKMLKEMYGNQDVSFIEIVVKFNAKYNSNDELRILEDVIDSLPNHYRSMKRAAEDAAKTAVSAKVPRLSDADPMSMDVGQTLTQAQIAGWNMNMQAAMMGMQQTYEMMPHMPPPQLVIPNPIVDPLMVPNPSFVSTMTEVPKMVEEPPNFQQPSFQQVQHSQLTPTDSGHYTKDNDEGHHLYLCKDDFEPFSENQAEHLKRFLVAQLIKASESAVGWTPDFTVKGLQSQLRYELVTRDENTKDWIVNLDFSEFPLFNVLVYTKEELWYERAAIWLPGHSRCRNIEPLTKLKLQNRKLHGVHIEKWKLVKKIVNAKGTRVYVDMPPSSARALEKHKMMLSYELQKVNVFLKAVAVDKDSFDAGLKEMSIKDQGEIIAAVQNSPMPSLNNSTNIVKIALKGNKALSVVQARKIKEMVIYHIFKYQDKSGHSKTDFVKFGYILPGYFGILPENDESRRWLMSLDIGKLNRHAIVVLGADEAKTKYIRMTLYFNSVVNNNMAFVMERIKQSNKGVSGLNFHLWKPIRIRNDRRYSRFEIDMDLESVETIMKLKCQLDYVDALNLKRSETIDVKYDSRTKLEDVIKKYKAEQVDSYDVANMDLASSDEDDDIICMS